MYFLQYGYNTKYPMIRYDQKNYFLKNDNECKKLGCFEFLLI
jgi:hypothetical protein